MGNGQETTQYQVDISPAARDDLANYDASVRQRLANRIEWLVQNAERIQHQRLSHLPSHLRGLCKYRIGNYRVLYRVNHQQRTVEIFRIIPRKSDYRLLH